VALRSRGRRRPEKIRGNQNTFQEQKKASWDFGATWEGASSFSFTSVVQHSSRVFPQNTIKKKVCGRRNLETCSRSSTETHSTLPTSDVRSFFRAAVRQNSCVLPVEGGKAKSQEQYMCEHIERSKNFSTANHRQYQRTAWRNFVAVPRKGCMSLKSGPFVTPYKIVPIAARKPLRRSASSSSDLPNTQQTQQLTGVKFRARSVLDQGCFQCSPGAFQAVFPDKHNRRSGVRFVLGCCFEIYRGSLVIKNINGAGLTSAVALPANPWTLLQNKRSTSEATRSNSQAQ